MCVYDMSYFGGTFQCYTNYLGLVGDKSFDLFGKIVFWSAVKVLVKVRLCHFHKSHSFTSGVRFFPPDDGDEVQGRAAFVLHCHPLTVVQQRWRLE